MRSSIIADAIRGYTPDITAVELPLLIAEVGVNHEGSLDTARKLIDAAAAGGADAVKFQTYRAETLAAAESPAYWDLEKESTESQRELFSKYDSFWVDEYAALASHCDEVGIEFMSTPFDLESTNFLAEIMGVFKVASADITNHPFLRHIASFGKPMLISTGASSVAEISAALDVVGDTPTCLMHCILNYPTDRKDANLGMILDLRRRFPDSTPGYSDHTVPDADMDVIVTAALLGARVIETHFTLDKTLPGNDHYHALDEADLRHLRSRLDATFSLVGERRKRPIEAELAARRFARRSLVATHDLPAGHVLALGDLTWKRPGTGISPADIDAALGSRTRGPVAADTVIDWSMIE